MFKYFLKSHQVPPIIYYGLLTMVTCFSITGCEMLPWQRKPDARTPEQMVKQADEKLMQYPDNTVVRTKWYSEREKAIETLSQLADQAERKGDFELATAAYVRLLQIDPNHRKALAYMDDLARDEKHNTQLKEAKKFQAQHNLKLAKSLVHDVLLEEPSDQAAKTLNQEIDKKDGYAKAILPQLKAPFQKPVTLELRDANIRVVFEALSRATGINFILDRDIKADTKASVFVKKLPIEDAIEMVLASNGLQKKVLSDNSVLVYPNTQQKLKDYQDLVIRNFYFTNSTAKQTADMLKMVLKSKDIFVDERLNMLVIRDRPEVVRLAEKLIRAQDVAEPEVMLDIEVLEVTRSKFQDLGVTYPTQLSVISSTTLTLEALKRVNSNNLGFNTNPSITAKATENDVNILSSPRIRVKNNEKAKVTVGDKVPVITTNTNSATTISTTETVNYIDVGLKLDIEPRVTLDDYVNIKVGLEVSSLGDSVELSNKSKVYTIGTRNASTVLRLKNGETQILAGLIQDSERKGAIKVPGFGDVPLLGRLFSKRDNSKTKTEIVLAITPRIISNIRLPDAEFSEYWSGTDSLVSDKPLINVPASNDKLTPQERMLQMRQQRSQEINATEPVVPTVNSEVSNPAEVVLEVESQPLSPPQEPTSPAAGVTQPNNVIKP